ncbi:uncharacterized protein LOC131238730 [Magnolia sinica]|uniref:uncharacterized protein LOC131238730 n=1 Tax=Magnolia sinica TaxID=86752 RepID=UPI002659E706|nr:uncharacterized protein LOC131238730 [Magnolia sinica]
MSDLAYSSHELLPLHNGHDDPNLEGVSANVKLLLKLIHDHKDDDGRKMQRVAGMISIIDDVKYRIEKSQMAIKKAQFRRCNTELRRSNVVMKERKPHEVHEENQKLRRELLECMASRKNLEKMFSSLGKEKEIMATELAHKAQQLSNMEEEVNDIKAQNEKLSEKIKAYAAHHKDKRDVRLDAQVNVALQERNKMLSDQLLKSLDGYRSLKRRTREIHDENASIQSKIADIAKEVEVGLNRIHDLQQRVKRSQEPMDVEEELSTIENLFRCFEQKITFRGPSRSVCV